MSWKPEGYPSVLPYLVVESAERVVEFCKAVLDAEELRRYEQDGRIMHSDYKGDRRS